MVPKHASLGVTNAARGCRLTAIPPRWHCPAGRSSRLFVASWSPVEECCGIDADHSRAARSGTFRNPAEKAGTLMSHSDNQRPWPAPARPWAMRMRWCDLLFAHWRVEAAAPPSGCPAPVGADMPTRMPDSEIHSADDWDRSGCWTDGDFTAGSSRIQ